MWPLAKWKSCSNWETVLNLWFPICHQIAQVKMADTYSFRKLKVHILERSIADNFNDAKLEWVLDRIMLTTSFGRCPCGKQIKEHCYLRNQKNEKTTWVGNVCVRRFMNIDSRHLFTGLKKILENNSATPNTTLIEYAWTRTYMENTNMIFWPTSADDANCQRNNCTGYKKLIAVFWNKSWFEPYLIKLNPVLKILKKIQLIRFRNDTVAIFNGEKLYLLWLIQWCF